MELEVLLRVLLLREEGNVLCANHGDDELQEAAAAVSGGPPALHTWLSEQPGSASLLAYYIVSTLGKRLQPLVPPSSYERLIELLDVEDDVARQALYEREYWKWPVESRSMVGSLIELIKQQLTLSADTATNPADYIAPAVLRPLGADWHPDSYAQPVPSPASAFLFLVATDPQFIVNPWPSGTEMECEPGMNGCTTLGDDMATAIDHGWTGELPPVVRCCLDFVETSPSLSVDAYEMAASDGEFKQTIIAAVANSTATTTATTTRAGGVSSDTATALVDSDQQAEVSAGAILRYLAAYVLPTAPFSQQRSPDMDSSGASTNDVAAAVAVLGYYFKQLPTPVIPHALYDKFVSLGGSRPATDRIQGELSELICEMPRLSARVVVAILRHGASLVESAGGSDTPRGKALIKHLSAVYDGVARRPPRGRRSSSSRKRSLTASALTQLWSSLPPTSYTAASILAGTMPRSRPQHKVAVAMLSSYGVCRTPGQPDPPVDSAVLQFISELLNIDASIDVALSSFDSLPPAVIQDEGNAAALLRGLSIKVLEFWRPETKPVATLGLLRMVCYTLAFVCGLSVGGGNSGVGSDGGGVTAGGGGGVGTSGTPWMPFDPEPVARFVNAAANSLAGLAPKLLELIRLAFEWAGCSRRELSTMSSGRAGGRGDISDDADDCVGGEGARVRSRYLRDRASDLIPLLLRCLPPLTTIMAATPAETASASGSVTEVIEAVVGAVLMDVATPYSRRRGGGGGGGGGGGVDGGPLGTALELLGCLPKLTVRLCRGFGSSAGALLLSRVAGAVATTADPSSGSLLGRARTRRALHRARYSLCQGLCTAVNYMYSRPAGLVWSGCSGTDSRLDSVWIECLRAAAPSLLVVFTQAASVAEAEVESGGTRHCGSGHLLEEDGKGFTLDSQTRVPAALAAAGLAPTGRGGVASAIGLSASQSGGLSHSVSLTSVAWDPENDRQHSWTASAAAFLTSSLLVRAGLYEFLAGCTAVDRAVDGTSPSTSASTSAAISNGCVHPTEGEVVSCLECMAVYVFAALTELANCTCSGCTCLRAEGLSLWSDSYARSKCGSSNGSSGSRSSWRDSTASLWSTALAAATDATKPQYSCRSETTKRFRSGLYACLSTVCRHSAGYVSGAGGDSLYSLAAYLGSLPGGSVGRDVGGSGGRSSETLGVKEELLAALSMACAVATSPSPLLASLCRESQDASLLFARTSVEPCYPTPTATTTKSSTSSVKRKGGRSGTEDGRLWQVLVSVLRESAGESADAAVESRDESADATVEYRDESAGPVNESRAARSHLLEWVRGSLMVGTAVSLFRSSSRTLRPGVNLNETGTDFLAASTAASGGVATAVETFMSGGVSVADDPRAVAALLADCEGELLALQPLPPRAFQGGVEEPRQPPQAPQPLQSLVLGPSTIAGLAWLALVGHTNPAASLNGLAGLARCVESAVSQPGGCVETAFGRLEVALASSMYACLVAGCLRESVADAAVLAAVCLDGEAAFLESQHDSIQVAMAAAGTAEHLSHFAVLARYGRVDEFTRSRVCCQRQPAAVAGQADDVCGCTCAAACTAGGDCAGHWESGWQSVLCELPTGVATAVADAACALAHRHSALRSCKLYAVATAGLWAVGHVRAAALLTAGLELALPGSLKHTLLPVSSVFRQLTSTVVGHTMPLAAVHRLSRLAADCLAGGDAEFAGSVLTAVLEFVAQSRHVAVAPSRDCVCSCWSRDLLVSSSVVESSGQRRLTNSTSDNYTRCQLAAQQTEFEDLLAVMGGSIERKNGHQSDSALVRDLRSQLATVYSALAAPSRHYVQDYTMFLVVVNYTVKWASGLERDYQDLRLYHYPRSNGGGAPGVEFFSLVTKVLWPGVPSYSNAPDEVSVIDGMASPLSARTVARVAAAVQGSSKRFAITSVNVAQVEAVDSTHFAVVGASSAASVAAYVFVPDAPFPLPLLSVPATAVRRESYLV